MFLWSFFTCVLSDPGKVPLYWVIIFKDKIYFESLFLKGFFLDDPEHKKRRYCLICHIFKPERCHHCSACNRCVLNMDRIFIIYIFKNIKILKLISNFIRSLPLDK